MNRKSLVEYLRSVFHYRELLLYLVLADLKCKQKNTVLGFIWSFLNPLLTMLVYLFIFKVIFSVQIEDYPLFLFWGLLPFRATQSAVKDSASSIVGESRLINNVAFPRIILPLTQVLSSGYQFAMTMLILLPVSFFLGGRISLSFLLLPSILFFQMIMTCGLSFIFSTLNTYYRDTENFLPHLMRMWFYLSPGVYDLAHVPQSLKQLYLLNPYSVILPAYRDIMIYGRIPNFSSWLLPALVTFILFVLGLLLFWRHEKSFPKLV